MLDFRQYVPVIQINTFGRIQNFWRLIISQTVQYSKRKKRLNKKNNKNKCHTVHEQHKYNENKED
jgi:hypothetical protein